MRSGFIIHISVLLLASLVAISPLIHLSASSQSINIRTQPITIFDANREYIYVEYRGSADILGAVVRSDPGILVEGAKQVGDTALGYFKVYIVNATSKSYLCALSLVSSQPFSLNISLRSGDLPASQSQMISVPANITAQIEIPINYGSYQQPVVIAPTVSYTPTFPLWSLIAYVALIPMFLATAYLDKGSLKSIRKRWSAFDTFALTLRYLFYSSLVIFFLVTFGVIFEFFMIRFYSLGITLHAGDWLLACALLSVFGLIYGVGRWRGLFDNIDEED
ncbi:MAG: hypothetical protein N3D12_06285 [Candidatus Methanomethyliaceae archaeon]|nr:hypothetical protein [Candidatus Methanomethyliaceae archaeon]